MSRWPRAYRLQTEREDREKIERITRTPDPVSAGSAGRLRGIPAIGPNCPGHIRDTQPLQALLRNIR